MSVNSVDNPDYSSGQRITIKSLDNQILKCLGNGTFVDSNGSPKSNECALSADRQMVAICGNGNYKVSIPNKYKMTYLKCGSAISANIEELSFCKNLGSLEITNENTFGNIAVLKELDSLASISLAGTSVYGTLDNLPKNTESVYLTNSKVEGMISDAGKLTSLTHLILVDTNIQGRIEDFAQSQFNNGRTSGSIYCNFIRSGITYNESAINKALTIQFTSSGYSIL